MCCTGRCPHERVDYANGGTICVLTRGETCWEEELIAEREAEEEREAQHAVEDE